MIFSLQFFKCAQYLKGPRVDIFKKCKYMDKDNKNRGKEPPKKKKKKNPRQPLAADSISSLHVST